MGHGSLIHWVFVCVCVMGFGSLIWFDGFWFGVMGLLVGSDRGCWGGGFWLRFVL